MSLTNYSKFKISVNPDSKKIQSLQPGDIVRRQYVDGINTFYTLMAVLSIGSDEVINDKGVIVHSPYFVGVLLEGDIPNTQQVLDFVRITNLFNADRSGALYLTASDSEAPFMRVIDKLGTEKSICLPYLIGGTVNQPSRDKFAFTGENNIIISYNNYSEGSYRSLKVVRNSNTISGKTKIKLTFPDTFKIQDKVLISYKTRGNKRHILPYSFGYTDDSLFEAESTTETSISWEYKLNIVQIDNPAHDLRSFSISLDNLLVNDWIEIAEVNIIKLSDISNFSEAGKATIGNINSIVDPVFGSLKGYGIHTENLYATNNVGIAGTLTAGDSNGFSSTFYAGKIYKNMLKKSLTCDFGDSAVEVNNVKIPAKIGSAYKFKNSVNIHNLLCREAGWLASHKDELVTFSIWVYSEVETSINILQNSNKIDTWNIQLGWRRYNTTFTLYESAEALKINFETNSPLIVCSPQLEQGDTVSQYQPTDGTLKEDTDGYGAWFCEGGIGGTIQNPLLRLGSDGSIRSRSDSFYILPDGSAYFRGQVEIGDKSTLNKITLIKDGTINTDVLNVRAIFSKEITTETIVGSNLIFKTGTVGGWKITADMLTSETTAGRDHIEMSAIGGIKAIVASRTVWQLSPTGSGILASGKIRWDKDGNSIIAGWNITDDKLYSTLTTNNEQVVIHSSGSIQSTTGSIVNWILNNDGTGKLARGNVSWDKLGNLNLVGSITSSGGKIGGWNINDSSIYKNSIYLGSDGSIYHTSGYWKLNNDGSGQLANGAIKWGSNGIWNVDKITANTGSIGAWNIDSNSLYSGMKQVNNDYTYSGITLSSDGALRSQQFRIDANGNAYFKGTLSASGGTFSGDLSAAGGTFTGTLSGVNGDFSGRIKADSGSIGSWSINSGGMTCNDVYIASNGDLFCSYGGTERWRLSNNGAGHLANNKISWDVYGNVVFDSSIKINTTITAAQVNALSLTTVQGTIGGWLIDSNSIHKNSIYLGSDGSIYNGSSWRFNNDGSGQLSNGNISWTNGGKLTVSGTVNALSGIIGPWKISETQLKYVGTNYSTISKLYIGNVESGNPDTSGARITAIGIDASYGISNSGSQTTDIKNMFVDNVATNSKKTSLLVKTSGGAKNTAMAIFGNVAIAGDIANLGIPLINTLPTEYTGFDHNTCLISSASSLTLPTGESIRSWFGNNPNWWKNYGTDGAGSLDAQVYDLYVAVAQWSTNGCTIYGNSSGNSDSNVNGTPLYGDGVNTSGYGSIKLNPGRCAHFKKVRRQWFLVGLI